MTDLMPEVRMTCVAPETLAPSGRPLPLCRSMSIIQGEGKGGATGEPLMLDAVRVSTGETQETVVHLCGSCGGGFSPMWPLGALSQNGLFEAKSENRVSENQ